MKIQVLGDTINTKDLPKPVGRKIVRKRFQSAITPYVKMTIVAVVVDLALRAML